MHNASTGVTMEFTYNHEGIRTQKVKKINDEVVETTDYTLAGKKIICMQKGNDRLLFHYDESGSLIMLRHNGTPYTYVKNLQGDIVGLIDSTGALVVEYKYDAWGNPISTRTLTSAYDALAELNPFRYRGYVWDEDTERYYVSSRYYKPELIRWSNADGYVSTGQGFVGCNMYAYCNNNPVIFKDPSGHAMMWVLIMALGMATILGGCAKKETEPEPLPYKTADDAALAFANSTYSSCKYIRHEYGTVIYSCTINGVTTYNYATPVAGNPHSVGYGNVEIPSGMTIVATAHTHPNSNNFSGGKPGDTSGDIPNAIRRGLDSYVIGPNLVLQKFSIFSGTVTDVDYASPIELTSQQQDALVSQFQMSWDNHLGTCYFGCEYMIWPTP